MEKKLKKTNRQDMVFIRLPGISEGAFQLRMGIIWFCKLLLLFKIRSKPDTGVEVLDCAYVSVLEEYSGPRRSISRTGGTVGWLWNLRPGNLGPPYRQDA